MSGVELYFETEKTNTKVEEEHGARPEDATILGQHPKRAEEQNNRPRKSDGYKM